MRLINLSYMDISPEILTLNYKQNYENSLLLIFFYLSLLKMFQNNAKQSFVYARDYNLNFLKCIILLIIKPNKSLFLTIIIYYNVIT